MKNECELLHIYYHFSCEQEVLETHLKNTVVTTFLTPSVRTGVVVLTAVETATTTVFEMTCE